MPARYHPVYDGVWDDDAFDAKGSLPRAPFEEISFFVFLFANRRQRPSGIYRATDEQLSTDSRLPIETVRERLRTLEKRRRIVRDGSWIFVRGYFARQPKGDRLLIGVQEDLMACSSVKIRKSFCLKYTAFKWVDGLVKVRRRSPAPSRELPPQSSAEQSRALPEQSSAGSGVALATRKPVPIAAAFKDQLAAIKSRHPELSEGGKP